MDTGFRANRAEVQIGENFWPLGTIASLDGFSWADVCLGADAATFGYDINVFRATDDVICVVGYGPPAGSGLLPDWVIAAPHSDTTGNSFDPVAARI